MKKLLAFTALLFSFGTFAQKSMGVGTLYPDQNAKFHVVATTEEPQGSIPVPELPNASIAALALQMSGTSGPNGLMVFSSEDRRFLFWKDDHFEPLISGDTDSDNQQITQLIVTSDSLFITLEDGNTASAPLSIIKDHDFYKAGTTTQSDNINNDIYTMGMVCIGDNVPTNSLTVVATSNPIKIVGLNEGAASDSVVTRNAAGVLRVVEQKSWLPEVYRDFTESTNLVGVVSATDANATTAIYSVLVPDLMEGDVIIASGTVEVINANEDPDDGNPNNNHHSYAMIINCTIIIGDASSDDLEDSGILDIASNVRHESQISNYDYVDANAIYECQNDLGDKYINLVLRVKSTGPGAADQVDIQKGNINVAVFRNL